MTSIKLYPLTIVHVDTNIDLSDGAYIYIHKNCPMYDDTVLMYSGGLSRDVYLVKLMQWFEENAVDACNEISLLRTHTGRFYVKVS